jgi:GxxExxY protein
MIYEKELSDKIIGCAFEVYNHLESGYLEKIYENALMIEFQNRNINAYSQVPIKVLYKNQVVGDYFADIIVEDKIVLELKSCSEIHDSHLAQLLNYLTATNKKIGYVLNFGNENKLQFKRIVK